MLDLNVTTDGATEIVQAFPRYAARGCPPAPKGAGFRGRGRCQAVDAKIADAALLGLKSIRSASIPWIGVT